MKIIILLVLLFVIMSSCNESKLEEAYEIDLYGCPRNFSCSFSYDVGIFRYALKKKNIVNLKSDCCFLYKTVNKNKDSVIEMSYSKIVLTKKIFDTLFQSSNLINDSIYQQSPRALFLVKKSLHNIDTIFLDKNLTIRYGFQTFKANKGLVDFFYNNLPLEVKENWIENYPYQSRFNIIK
jgi:hypothetical protein